MAHKLSYGAIVTYKNIAFQGGTIWPTQNYLDLSEFNNLPKDDVSPDLFFKLIIFILISQVIKVTEKQLLILINLTPLLYTEILHMFSYHCLLCLMYVTLNLCGEGPLTSP